MIRTAISPRLAIRIRLNINGPKLTEFYTESSARELTVWAADLQRRILSRARKESRAV